MNNICGDVLIFFVIAISFFNCCYAKKSYAYVRQNDENCAVRKFRDYLKIQTVHPDPKDGYRTYFFNLLKQIKAYKIYRGDLIF